LVGANEFPSFLYPNDTVYNPRDQERGLFRGHILIRTLHALYTGQSSALTGHRTAMRESQGELHEMRELFPEAIAYAAVEVCLSAFAVCIAYCCIQAHFALSSLGNWSEIEKCDFDYFKFFKNCVTLLNDPDEE
ncbi:hypothetical protein BDQ17DRAFT_1171359, partial [Cyathus striatus]